MKLFFILLFLLSLIYSTPLQIKPDETLVSGCSIEKSRHVRDILENIFEPILKYHDKYEVPASCLLHPNHDQLMQYNLHAQIGGRGKYKCPWCDKKFKTKNFLESHWANAHSDKVLKNATVCLGDFCDILQCDENQYIDLTECVPSENRKFYCWQMMQECFPITNPIGRKLNSIFTKQFCDPLTCSFVPSGKEELLNLYSRQLSALKILGLFGLIFVCGFLFLYYFLFYLYSKDTRPKKFKSQNYNTLTLNEKIFNFIQNKTKIKGY